MPYYIKDPKRDPNFDNHPCDVGQENSNMRSTANDLGFGGFEVYRVLGFLFEAFGFKLLFKVVLVGGPWDLVSNSTFSDYLKKNLVPQPHHPLILSP